jgi:phage terminase large subunit
MNLPILSEPTRFSKSSGLLEAIQGQRRKREIEASQGGWERENAKCAADILYWFDNYVWTYDPRLVRQAGRGVRPVQALAASSGSLSSGCRPDMRPRRGAAREEPRRRRHLSDVLGSPCTNGCTSPASRRRSGLARSTTSTRRTTRTRSSPSCGSCSIGCRRDAAGRLQLAQHDNYMRMVNPATSAVISGEGGEDMGRGGRSSMYFVDEAAFVPNAETVEKALSGNTDCVIWVSSVNGMGNLFARKRHSILKPHQIFRLHWRDDPRKTEAWAAAKQASFSDPSTWAAEYDIDYSASVEGICIPALWVESAKRLAKLEPTAAAIEPLQGRARRRRRQGQVRCDRQARSDGAAAAVAGQPRHDGNGALGARHRQGDRRGQLNFDAPGVGAGVSSTLMKNPVAGLKVVAVNTGLPPSNASGRTVERRKRCSATPRPKSGGWRAPRCSGRMNTCCSLRGSPTAKSIGSPSSWRCPAATRTAINSASNCPS